MWMVVLFENDNTLAAVPEFWHCKGICAWPKKVTTKIIQKRTKPNDLEFSYYKAKVLFSHIGTFLYT